MKFIALSLLLLSQTVFASSITCYLRADGPDYSAEVEFESKMDKENYFYDEQEVNESIFSSVVIERDDAKTVSIYMALTDEDDYAAEDSFTLQYGQTQLTESSYMLNGKKYNYSFLCSYE